MLIGDEEKDKWIRQEDLFVVCPLTETGDHWSRLTVCSVNPILAESSVFCN